MTSAHPTNEKGYGLRPVPFQKHPTNEPDYRIGDQPSLEKLVAKFARAGHLVHQCANKDYLIVKSDWCMSRYCPNYAALVAFGRMLGVLQ